MTVKQRERMTWDADRKASAPPAIPGYNVEDQDHPAKQGPDPDMHKYENGDTSSWAEDVRQPPYPEGNPPALPGYDAEDQDHPAHQSPQRVSLTAAVRKRASKCLKLAAIQLEGKKMTKAQIEDHAMDLMELGDSQINNMLSRFGGGFLADEMMEEVIEPVADDLDELLSMEDLDDEMALEEPILASEDEKKDDDPDKEASAEKTAMESILAKLEAMSAEIAALKGESIVAADEDTDDDEEADKEAASQNDPNGPTLSPTPKTEEEARKEASDPILQEFDSYDTGKTGFVSVDEWQGSKAVFAALDTDNDQILARVDLEASCDCGTTTIEAGLDPEEVAMLAEMTATNETTACSPTAEIIEDDLLVEDPMELELVEEPIVEEPMVVAEDEAGMFGMTHDPMGLSDGAPVMSSKDDALLEEIFGGKVAKKSEEEEVVEEEEVEGKKKAAKKSEEEEIVEEEVEVEGKKKAAKTATQRPQPRKKSAGVQQVGNVTKTAANNELKELQNMWASDPDVSEVFGS